MSRTTFDVMSKPQKKRRHVHVPAPEGSRGRLWGYGTKTLAAMAGMTEAAVKKAIERGAFEPSDLRSVVAWLVSRERQETPGKGWKPCPPGLSDRVIAGLIAASPRLVRHARTAGHFDPQDSLSLAAWLYERKRWGKPVPARSFSRYMLVAVARPPARHKQNARRLQATIAKLIEMGFTAELRGGTHIYLKPDYLPLSAAERLVAAMNESGLTAAEVSLRRRRRLALGPSVATQRGGSRVSRSS